LEKDASRLVNVFALTSVGMVVIGHLHFSFLLYALKRSDVRQAFPEVTAFFVAGVVWILLVVNA
jgi:hypothetical protein